MEINLFPIEPHDPPIVVSAKVNFAYDNSFLYGFVYIPDLEGQVYTTEIMFFGREEQGETIDSIFMNASDNRVEDHEGDVNIFVFGQTADMFEIDKGADVAVITPESYEDMVFDQSKGGPISDIDVGGTIDNQSMRQIEFSKPLSSGDTKGGDFQTNLGESIYFTNIAQYESEEPNYFDATYDNESIPALSIHELRILKEGEEPTENNINTDTNTDTNTDLLNTFSLDYSLSYSLAAIMILMTLISVRKKRII